MRKKHRDAFNTFSATFKPKTIATWTKMVDEWISDRTKFNPYDEPQNSELTCHLYIGPEL